MGKKAKVGKQRKDKYYQLAKESGYRSRASFKLIQLNRKFQFLERSKVLIDLCAAPGGWLQVAQKFMPVSSVILGVDLVPIKPIPNVITLQEDITTSKCRNSLKKNLKTWKADVVLHDGAPNVGKSWIHDAFEQNRLTLSALHLACDFLMKGGWFITKVFRSKDYNSLLWVLNKLFKKVFATKPLASRNESAEIFIVCQNFIAPDKIEAKFFDPSYVFADLEENEHKISANDLLKSRMKMKKAKAEGYEDGETILYHKLNASKFINDPNYADLLSKASEIVLDNEQIKNHPSTTPEIRECIKDIKVLGRKELLLLINWRKGLRAEFKKLQANEKAKDKSEIKSNSDGDNEDDDESDVEEIDSFESEEAIKMKRKKKKIAKEKRKLAERMNLKMIIENDQLVQEEQDLFSLSKILNSSQMDQIQDVEPDILCDEDDKDEDIENYTENETAKKRKMFYDKDFNQFLEDPEESDLSEDDNDSIEMEDTDHFKDEEQFNSMEEVDCFEEFSDDEEALKFEKLVNTITKNRQDQENEMDKESNESIEEPKEKSVEKSNGDEIIENKTKKQMIKEKTLSVEELAIGSMLIKSQKSKRILMDDAWNRFTHDDFDEAPSWFRKEEQVYCRKPIDIAREFLKKSKETKPKLNKKEIEAKARKKKRVLRRLEKARLKAENLTEDPTMSNKEKADCIRRIYKKASVKKDKQPSLVVAKKQYGNRRPPGVKGRYKIVDARMKKDKRKLQQNDKKMKKNKSNKKFNKNKKQKSK